MKYLKILGLAAVAAMALMAFAGTASATKLYSGGTALGTGTQIKADLEGTSVLKSGSTTINTCKGGQFFSEITNAGSSSTTVSGPNNTIDFEECENPVHTITPGSLEVHHIAGTTNGTLTVSGAIIANTVFGTSCNYESGTGKDLGTLNGGTPATISINVTVTEAEPKKFICPDTPTWTATFKVTTPSPLTVEAS
jgi:hypothetical protein